MTLTLRAVETATRSAEAATPLLVLGPSLGTTNAAWAPLAAQFAATFRVLSIDLPGHGRSPAAADAFTVADLADAVIALVDAAGGGRFAYAGVSLGGAIGIELAAGPHAGRLTALAAICTDARLGEPEAWQARAAQVRASGTPSMVRGSSERWFAPGFIARDGDTVGRMLNDLMGVDDESYARCCEALAGFDRRADLARIAVPTLVVHGEADPVVPPAAADALAAAIPGAERVGLADVGHQAHVEARSAVFARITAFLAETAGGGATPADDRYEAGLAVRSAVFGADYVAASIAGRTPETQDFQRFITETAWGSVWSRPGLDRRTRSVVTIASLVTAHHWHELELHLHGALRNGLTRSELAEILLQTAIYAGVPSANTAFGVLQRVLAEHGGDEAEKEHA